MSTQIVKTEKPGRKRYAESERRELLHKYGRSGMAQAAFCRANGLKAATFSKWLRARGGKGCGRSAAGFAEVEIVPPAVRDLAVEGLKQAAYFIVQVNKLHQRFPEAVYADVCKARGIPIPPIILPDTPSWGTYTGITTRGLIESIA